MDEIRIICVGVCAIKSRYNTACAQYQLRGFITRSAILSSLDSGRLARNMDGYDPKGEALKGNFPETHGCDFVCECLCSWKFFNAVEQIFVGGCIATRCYPANDGHDQSHIL